ncbi:condensation domain-containing protein [Streptomyces sp. MS1.HAVA.3]|uniref:Condensation domain-containing protein n=1 Tax=Streptomyces caledonius TaxID=3134107 RepID=A0ABU8U0U6_9ACTN
MTDEAYPLTFEAESIWISEQLFRQRSPYLETWAQRIEGPLDPEALRRAWEAFVLRHAALRTRFLLEDGGTVQRFAPEPPNEMEREQWPGGELEAVLREAGRRPLDLTRSPYRATLYERSPLDHVLLVQVHHIIVDDVSLSVLNEELGALYTAQVTGEAPALPPLARGPGAYAVAQRAAGVSPAALDFWADYLADVTPLPQLPPYPRPLPPRRGPGTDMVSVVLPAETRKAVRDTARALRTTPHVVFAAAMAMTFSATVEVEDVVLGTPTSRRGAAELDRMFGCLTDLMPLRVHVPRTMSFAEACATTKKNVLTTLRHRQTPYAAISSNLRSAQSLRSSDNLAGSSSSSTTTRASSSSRAAVRARVRRCRLAQVRLVPVRRRVRRRVPRTGRLRDRLLHAGGGRADAGPVGDRGGGGDRRHHGDSGTARRAPRLSRYDAMTLRASPSRAMP